MQPLDNSQFLTQLAQFVSIEQQSEKVTGINNLLSLSSSDQSLGLLSHKVQIANRTVRPHPAKSPAFSTAPTVSS